MSGETLGLLFLAKYLVVADPLGAAVGWLRNYRRDVFFALVVAGVAVALSYAMGLFYSHPAPYQVSQTIVSGAPENSFPSQHATVSFAFAWGVLRRGLRRAGLVFVVCAILVSYGRVAVGLHYPVDILGGIVASVVGLLVTELASDYVDQLSGLFVDIDDRMRTYVGLE